MHPGKDELARRMPFDSPMTNTIVASSTSSSPASQRITKKGNATTKRPVMKGVKEGGHGLPSLNIITNFPSAQKPVIHGRNPSIQERRKHSKKASEPRTVLDAQSALSATDGTLLIGICLPPGSIEAHNARLDTRRSIAPEIIITPAARLEDPWKSQKLHRPRSSVYSQATKISPGGQSGDNEIPPVPSIFAPGTSVDKTRPLSAASWHTDFSEDFEKNELCRRYSGESHLGMTRNLSVHTTRRKSEGWWNALKSPIFGRSNTFSKTKAPPLPTQLEQPYKQPHEFLATDPYDHEKQFFRDSIWTDLNRLDAQRQTLAFFDDSPTNTRAAKPLGGANDLTPELIQEQGFGFASEYYEASWHDAYSSTPFFKCTNHDCAQKTIYRHGKTIGGPDAAVEIQGLTVKNLEALTSQTSTLKGSAQHSIASEVLTASGFRSPIQDYKRRDSGETEIDDAPDFYSERHESHSKPTSKAASPMPETQYGIKSFDRFQTPEPIIADDIRTPEKSPIVMSAKALRIVGLENRLRTPESTARRTPSREMSEAITSTAKQTPQASSKPTAVAILDDPFNDTAYCLSPEALSPGLRKDFVQHDAIPMQPTPASKVEKQQASASSSTKHDPLNIAEPRKAPLPPQVISPEKGSLPKPVESNPAPMVAMYGLPGKRPVYYESTTTLQSHAEDEKISVSQKDQPEDKSIHFPPPPTSRTLKKNNEQKEKTNSNGKSTIFGCISRKKDESKPKRKRWYCLICCALLGIVILILVLVLTFTLHRSDSPAQTSFLNITGFPPMPTGISTIAQPIAAIEDSQCVAPNTLWSCSVPKEQQPLPTPNAADQPNFRLEIRFQNDSSVLNSSNTINSRSVSNAVGAGSFMKRQFLRSRDAFTSSLFSPSPAPPSQADQIFLGSTTDNNTAPSQGEATPFFISFLSTTDASSKRTLTSRDNSNPFPNITSQIPPPSTNSDGTAAPANLLPFPTAQPLMLYNRGRNDEHYGFYTYFDRSIFLKSTDLLNSTGPDIADNANGGATESAADVRCTWSQTRFLVQIWTNSGNALQLLNSGNKTSSSANSPTNFIQPGSFPYPVSVTLDRHGGDPKQKMLYCYGIDETNHIINSDKQIHLENRNSGGLGLVNPAGGIFTSTANASAADSGSGGIDGGFGGCRCQWRNWIQV